MLGCDYEPFEGKCRCRQCGHVSLQPKCHHIHRRCPMGDGMPGRRGRCIHLGERTGSIQTTGRCRKLVALYRCLVYNDDTTLIKELPPRLCCAKCTPEDGKELRIGGTNAGSTVSGDDRP